MFTTKEINSLFDSFNDKTALVIGDVMLDSYLFGDVDRISPEAPVPVVAVTKRDNRPGGAANVALNIQSLGAKAVLCSITGNDVNADKLFEKLQENKLSTEGLVKSDDRPTTTKFRVIGNSTQLLRVDEEDDAQLSEIEQNAVFEKLEKLFKDNSFDVIIFEDYDKGLISEELVEFVVNKANNEGIAVVADPKKRNFDYYKNLSLFKPNLKELEDGLGFKWDGDINHLSEQAIRYCEEQNHKFVMTTLSKDGVLICNKDKCIHHTAHVRRISDVSGAGDTVISVVALCLAANVDVDKLGWLSNLAGGLVCEEVGVVPINKERLINETIELIGG